MKKRQNDKVSMFQSVLRSCGDHRSIWASHPGFKRGVDQLAGVLTGLSSLVQIQESARDGVSLTKLQITRDLVTQTLLISGAICAYCHMAGDRATAEAFDLNATDLMNLRDNVMDDKAQAVHDKARELLETEANNPLGPDAARMADYGLTQAALSLLQARIALYTATLESPRSATINISSATAGIDRLMEEGDNLLRLILDKLILQYEAEHPDFVRHYESARIIVDTGVRSPREEKPTVEKV